MCASSSTTTMVPWLTSPAWHLGYEGSVRAG
jgi:hypothetical protein